MGSYFDSFTGISRDQFIVSCFIHSLARRPPYPTSRGEQDRSSLPSTGKQLRPSTSGGYQSDAAWQTTSIVDTRLMKNGLIDSGATPIVDTGTPTDTQRTVGFLTGGFADLMHVSSDDSEADQANPIRFRRSIDRRSTGTLVSNDQMFEPRSPKTIHEITSPELLYSKCPGAELERLERRLSSREFDAFLGKSTKLRLVDISLTRQGACSGQNGTTYK
ncbi:unnamed protein product [Protopolystoma xenopodis]|uniref:Uncharacterized protein n=1 Tax=Protopolystoma xenopodis TaxID=117903 RepID=A0A3S5CCR6_9PLAT|nr:unnamed protein product [Protopolystoma xenopodis]